MLPFTPQTHNPSAPTMARGRHYPTPIFSNLKPRTCERRAGRLGLIGFTSRSPRPAP
jgi:hypothetical protein